MSVTREKEIMVAGMPTIGSVMTPLPRAVDVNTPLREVRKLMRERGIHHVPVRKSGELVALLSDRDMKRALDPALGLPGVDELFAADVAVFEPVSVDEATLLDEALTKLVELRIGSLLVERDGDLLGIFTATDACRLFAEHLRAAMPPAVV